MQTTTLALLSATTVGTLGTIVALPVDQTRAAAILRKARRRVCRAERRMQRKAASAAAAAPGTAVDAKLPEHAGEVVRMRRSTFSDSTASTSSTSTAATPQSSTPWSESDHTGYTTPSIEADLHSIPFPSLPSLAPSQRTPHRPQPSIAVTCPDGYFYNLDLSTPVSVCASPISPSSCMSPKEGLGLGFRGLTLEQTMRVEVLS